MGGLLINSISAKISYYIENLDSVDFYVFLKSVCDDIIKDLNLEGYVNDIKILDSYDKNPSTKGMIDEYGNVFVYKNGIEKAIADQMQNVNGISELEVELFKILTYTKTIIHELQHAKQKKLLAEDSENKSLETLITRINEDIPVNSLFFYEFSPIERMAEITAYRSIVNILDVLESNYKIEMLSCFVKKQEIFAEFCDYHKLGPKGITMLYFEIMSPEKISLLETRMENLKADERVLYGLNITRQEYEAMVNRYGYFYDQLKTLLEKNKK